MTGRPFWKEAELSLIYLPPVGLAVLPLFLLFFELCFFLAVVSVLFLVVCEPLAGA